MQTLRSKTWRVPPPLRRAFGCFAYATSNPPVAISYGPLAGYNTTEDTSVGGKGWYYKSADAIATVKGAGYITNAVQLGMQVGDWIIVYDRTTPALSLAFVQSFTGNAANLDGTPLTAT